MVTRYFQRVDNTEQPVALFRLVVEPLAQTIEETQWETNVGWVGTDRLVAYLIDGSPIVDEVNERTAMRAFPDAFVSRVAKVTIAKHLAGKHDQKAHAGHGHGRDLKEVADKVNEKTALVTATGEIFVAGANGDEGEELELAKESVNLIIAQGAPNDDGMEMTMNALDKEGDPVVEDVFVAVDETGMVSGALAVSRQETYGVDISAGDDVDIDNLDEFITEVPSMMTLNYLGTTGLKDGVGSALFGSAVKQASKEKRGLVLEPLDKKARSFWEAMGFTDTVKVGQKLVLLETGLALDAQAVSDLAGLLT